jgi:transcriptional regulator with XRE-family HTH domain
MGRVRIQVTATKGDFLCWLSDRIYEKYGLRPSVGQLASDTGLSEQTVSDLYRRRRLPTEKTLMRLAPVLGIDCKTMMRLAGNAPVLDVDTEHLGKNPLSPEERRIVINLLETILKWVEGD